MYTSKPNKDMLEMIKEKINKTFNKKLVKKNYKIKGNIYTLSADIGIVADNRKNLIHVFAYKNKESIMKESMYKARALKEVQNENRNIFASMIVETPENNDEIFGCFNVAKKELENASWQIVELTDMNNHIEKIKKLYVSA